MRKIVTDRILVLSNMQYGTPSDNIYRYNWTNHSLGVL